MPRYFTVEQAERILPTIRSAVRDAIRLKGEHDAADAGLKEIGRKVQLSGGSNVNREYVQQLRSGRESALEALKEAIDVIQEPGCVIKDLDVGLLDFPAFYRGKEVYLCWKLGEERIEWWHHIEDGFQGRTPIDAEFRNNLGTGPAS